VSPIQLVHLFHIPHLPHPRPSTSYLILHHDRFDRAALSAPPPSSYRRLQPPRRSLTRSAHQTRHRYRRKASSQLTLPPRPGTRTAGLRLSAVARSLRPHINNHINTPPIAQPSIDSNYCSKKERQFRLSCATLICHRSTPRRVTACLTD
jgi:hypothetical protein